MLHWEFWHPTYNSKYFHLLTPFMWYGKLPYPLHVNNQHLGKRLSHISWDIWRRETNFHSFIDCSWALKIDSSWGSTLLWAECLQSPAVKRPGAMGLNQNTLKSVGVLHISGAVTTTYRAAFSLSTIPCSESEGHTEVWLSSSLCWT